MKKIIFPFFNREKHEFLTKKWWFRAIIVIFVSTFLLSIPVLLVSTVNGVYQNCTKSVLRSYGGEIPSAESISELNGYYNSLGSCNDLAREWWTMALAPSIITPIIIFYLVQLIFFKVVINYIVLGGKK